MGGEGGREGVYCIDKGKGRVILTGRRGGEIRIGQGKAQSKTKTEREKDRRFFSVENGKRKRGRVIFRLARMKEGPKTTYVN